MQEELEIWDLFDNVEMYPRCIAERGVPQGTCYTYISSTFLNGFINYVNPFYVAMIERYNEGWLNEEEYRKKVLEELKSPHTDYSPRLFDDIFILAESENTIYFNELNMKDNRSYWFFWSDRDCSDCSIGRFFIGDVTKKEVIKALEHTFKINHPGEGYNIGEREEREYPGGVEYIATNLSKKRWMELPLPNGWVTF